MVLNNISYKLVNNYFKFLSMLNRVYIAVFDLIYQLLVTFHLKNTF